MSKLTTVATTSHTLSVAAMEEASRLGEPTADIEHLLLALTINEQLAGQLLRANGVTIDATRDSIAAQRAEQLATLGVDAELPPPGRITFHDTTRAEWSERAIAIIRRASDGDRRGDAAAVLRELLGEPSGLVEAVLRRLGTSADGIRDRLALAETMPTPTANRPRDTLTGRAEAFAPASPDEVWALLTTPERMPEWDPLTGTVDDAPETVTHGATWTTRARRTRPDGRAARVPDGTETGVTRVDELTEPHRLTLATSWTDAPTTNARRLTVELEPAAGGTHLRLTLSWVRSTTRRRSPKRLLAPIMRPLQRYAVWLSLHQIGTGIGRAFR